LQGGTRNFTGVYGFAFASSLDAARTLPSPAGRPFLNRVTTMGTAPYEHDYWLAHADKAYARAEGMVDHHARLTMLSVAKGYACLAQHERERAELPVVIKKRDSK
jgi:hypothetical protein